MEKVLELYLDMKLLVVTHLYGTFGAIEKIRVNCDKRGVVIAENTA